MATTRQTTTTRTRARQTTRARPRTTTRRRTTTLRPQKWILNINPSQKTENDWTYDHAAEANIVAARAATIPSSKDLRASWWTINDQGLSGSCVGWATADSVLRWHFVKAGRLSTSQMVSPRFIWMASKETDQFILRPTTFIEPEGTSLKAALDVARKFGAVQESMLPFKPATLYPGTAQAFYASAAMLRILAYFNLGSDLSNWRTWLATKGPILTRLDVDATWDAATANGGYLADYQPATTRGGHAVAIVGYTSDRFVVRNSWGNKWGDKGFAYASLGYAQAAFTEAYGVQV